jgi:hypothetical protein
VALTLVWSLKPSKERRYSDIIPSIPQTFLKEAHMTQYEEIYKISNENNGIVTANMVAENNIDSWYLSDMVEKGKLTLVSRGIYTTEGGDFDEYFFFQLKNKRCIYSYSSALYLHLILKGGLLLSSIMGSSAFVRGSKTRIPPQLHKTLHSARAKGILQLYLSCNQQRPARRH